MNSPVTFGRFQFQFMTLYLSSLTALTAPVTVRRHHHLAAVSLLSEDDSASLTTELLVYQKSEETCRNLPRIRFLMQALAPDQPRWHRQTAATLSSFAAFLLHVWLHKVLITFTYSMSFLIQCLISPACWIFNLAKILISVAGICPLHWKNLW